MKLKSRNITVCGTFLTQRALVVIASLLFLVLILGAVSLGLGVDMYCSHTTQGNAYSYYDECLNTKFALIINGSVMMGFTVIGLVTVAVLACRMKDAPPNIAPTIVAHPPQPYNMSANATPVYPGNTIYSIATPGHSHQRPASTIYPAISGQQ